MIEENIESKIIKTQDENGEIYSFELIDVVEFNGREYGLLVHVEEEASAQESSEEDDEEEQEVVIMRLNKENDNYVFETIEDEDEFNQLIEYIEAEEDEDYEEE